MKKIITIISGLLLAALVLAPASSAVPIGPSKVKPTAAELKLTKTEAIQFMDSLESFYLGTCNPEVGCTLQSAETTAYDRVSDRRIDANLHLVYDQNYQPVCDETWKLVKKRNPNNGNEYIDYDMIERICS